MKTKIAFLLTFALILTSSFPSISYCAGGKEAGASLLLPTTGQAMNGELGAKKTKIMGGIEVASIATITAIGLGTGGAAVLFGAIPLAVNHIWSATDAYRTAKNQEAYGYNQQQVADAQQTIDYSRDRRFEREQAYRSNIRERIQRASEQYE